MRLTRNMTIESIKSQLPGRVFINDVANCDVVVVIRFRDIHFRIDMQSQEILAWGDVCDVNPLAILKPEI